MIYPTGVAVHRPSGDVYVVDSGNHRLQRFGARGAPLGAVGSAGTSAGQFASPKAVVCARDLVVVSDAGAHRLSPLAMTLPSSDAARASTGAR